MRAKYTPDWRLIVWKRPFGACDILWSYSYQWCVTWGARGYIAVLRLGEFIMVLIMWERWDTRRPHFRKEVALQWTSSVPSGKYERKWVLCRLCCSVFLDDRSRKKSFLGYYCPFVLTWGGVMRAHIDRFFVSAYFWMWLAPRNLGWRRLSRCGNLLHVAVTRTH